MNILASPFHYVMSHSVVASNISASPFHCVASWFFVFAISLCYVLLSHCMEIVVYTFRLFIPLSLFGHYEEHVSAFLLRYISFGGFSKHFGFAIRYFIVLYFVQSLYGNCCLRLLPIQCVISCSVVTSIVSAYPFHGYNTLF